MSVEFRAPFAGPTAIMFLPNPELQNQEAIEQVVNHSLAMDGSDYTYVKSGTNRRLTMTFANQGRGKLVEVQEFYKLHAGERVRFIDHRGDHWNMVFETGPLEFSTAGRAAPAGSSRQEHGTFELILVGAKI